jgi:cell division septation protein DedD
MGLRHDRGTEQACEAGGYEYGYRNPNGQFRTILAYSCRTGQCDNNAASGCVRIQRFSNPEFTYQGLPLGNADNDNARKLNDNRVTVANYYVADDAGPPTTAAPVTASPTSAPVTASPTSAPVPTTPVPTPGPTNPPPPPPAVTKYICQKSLYTPTAICAEGSTASFHLSLFIFYVSCAVVERGSFHLSLVPVFALEKTVSG